MINLEEYCFTLAFVKAMKSIKFLKKRFLYGHVKCVNLEEPPFLLFLCELFKVVLIRILPFS